MHWAGFGGRIPEGKSESSVKGMVWVPHDAGGCVGTSYCTEDAVLATLHLTLSCQESKNTSASLFKLAAAERVGRHDPTMSEGLLFICPVENISALIQI